jgi:hypothetical protein
MALRHVIVTDNHTLWQCHFVFMLSLSPSCRRSVKVNFPISKHSSSPNIHCPFERKVIIMVFDTCSAISGLIITNAPLLIHTMHILPYIHTHSARIGSPLQPQICVHAVVVCDIVRCQFTFINLRLGLLIAIRPSCYTFATSESLRIAPTCVEVKNGWVNLGVR